jgi:hypothetical protein
MKRISLVVAAVMSALTFGWATTAYSSILLITLRGTISSGWDYHGTFGSVGPLNGEDFTSTYQFDLSKSPGIYVPGSNWQIYIRGNHLGASIVINGVPRFVNSASDLFTDAWAPAFGEGPFEVQADADNTIYACCTVGLMYFRTASKTENFFLDTGPPSWASLNYTFQPSDYVDGHLDLARRDVNATLVPTSISIVEVPGPFQSLVPEPSVWAFMLAGFIGLGAVLRRKGGRLRAA